MKHTKNYGKIHIFHGKTHYFYGHAMSNSELFKLPERISWKIPPQKMDDLGLVLF